MDNTTQAFIEQCEADGRAEKLRADYARYGGWETRVCQRAALATLGLTALLEKPKEGSP